MNKIALKSIKEAEDMVFNIFLQGDMRHFDSFYLKLVADFIFNKAINIEKEIFDLKEVREEQLNSLNIPPPQKQEKYNALQIIQAKGLKFIGFEMPFLDYHIDVLAKKGNKDILIECGPCRLWKVIYCLEAGAELWITRDEKDKQTELFILNKGENWDKQLREFELRRTEELKKVKNPLDEL